MEECDEMIHRLAESIAYFYGKNANYSNDKIEVCTYGLELIISDLIVFLIAILVSIITKTFIDTILLLGTFILLRHQLGGFHASSHFRCNIIFFIAYILAVIAIKYIPPEIIKYLVIIIGVFSEVIAFIYAPVEHPNRPISERKKVKFKKIGVILLSLFWIVSIALTILFSGIESYALSIILGIFYVSISIVSEFYRQYYRNLLKSK